MANKENKQESKEKSKKLQDILDKGAAKAPTPAAENTQKLEEEVAKQKDQLMRLAAENENLRKRMAKEVEDANKYALTNFARDLLEVLENLHRAESSIDTEQLESNDMLKQIFTGVELTKKSLMDAFEKYGIQRIDPMGKPFDHDFHQAITQVPTAEHEPGTVVQVIQAGYTIKDRLLRPALVAVSKAEE